MEGQTDPRWDWYNLGSQSSMVFLLSTCRYKDGCTIKGCRITALWGIHEIWISIHTDCFYFVTDLQSSVELLLPTNQRETPQSTEHWGRDMTFIVQIHKGQCCSRGGIWKCRVWGLTWSPFLTPMSGSPGSLQPPPTPPGQARSSCSSPGHSSGARQRSHRAPGDACRAACHLGAWEAKGFMENACSPWLHVKKFWPHLR